MRHRSISLLPILALSLVSLLASACGNPGTSPGEAQEVTRTPRDPQPTGYVLDVAAANKTNGWTRVPLSALSPRAAEEAAAMRSTGIGIAVAFPRQGLVFELNGDETFAAESVGKVPLMLTMMANAEAEGRELTTDERILMAGMITQSDNVSADTAWNIAGGERKVSALLEAAGATDGEVGGENWGEMRLSPFDASVLLAEVVDGQLLTQDHRDLALDLMTEVAPWQDWGVGVGAPEDAIVGAKNGWYVEPEGWAVHSLAFVLPEDGEPYTVSFFTLGLDDYYAAIWAIESIARYLHYDIAN